MLREKIRKKLKSEQGTSIFFGLLLFLVASILSVVMLEGAVTTVKTVASDRKSEQNQLTCTSAAQVLRDSILKITLSANITVKKDNSDNEVETTKAWNNFTITGTSPDNLTSFAELLQSYINEVDQKNVSTVATDITVKKNLTLSTSGGGTAEAFTQFNDLEAVNAELTITPVKSSDVAKKNEVTYDIVVKLSSGTGSDSSRVILSLTGKVKPILKSSENTDSERTTVTQYDYTWEAKDIFYGDEERTLGDS